MSTKPGRGSAHRGRPASIPAGSYEPPVGWATPATLEVHFVGEDNRTRTFDIGTLPLPGWHTAVTAAFALRVGPTGGIRTAASTANAWYPIRRFLTYLAALPHPPLSPDQLSVAQITAFRAQSALRVHHAWASAELRQVAQILTLEPLRQLLSAEVIAFAQQRMSRTAYTQATGYSDGELRRLIAAARTDTQRISNRIQAGQAAIEQLSSSPAALTAEERDHAQRLHAVQHRSGSGSPGNQHRVRV